jgi:hypothetical protein
MPSGVLGLELMTHTLTELQRTPTLPEAHKLNISFTTLQGDPPGIPTWQQTLRCKFSNIITTQ